MIYPENCGYNRLEPAFMRYVNDAYSNGEFALPVVQPPDDIISHIETEGDEGYTVITRLVAGSHVKETLSIGGDENISLNNGELSVQVTPDYNFVRVARSNEAELAKRAMIATRESLITQSEHTKKVLAERPA